MKKFLYTVFPLWIATVGLVSFYKFVIIPNMQGDLGELGKIPTKLYYERDSDMVIRNIAYPTIQKIESIKTDTFDIITCGDSFSQQGKYGFQNYMARKGYKIINYFPYGSQRWNSFQLAFDLMNLEYVDSTNVKVLIIESVERELVNRLSKLDFTHTTLEEGSENSEQPEKKGLLSESKIYLDFLIGTDHGENPVKKLKLSKPMFSGHRGTDLYIYQDDVENGCFIPNDAYLCIKANIDRLFAKASSKGIELIVLICPDKYDMYQDYVVNNTYPKKTINEDFRRVVGDNKNIVIGKEILSPYIKKGDKDMYYFDDTHWTFRSARIIADTLSKIYNEIIQGPHK